MAFSVNTNSSALAALQNLNNTQNELSSVQQRINTGLKVSSAKDDSSAFVIAQNLRSDLSGMKSVTSSLNRAKSVLDVTLNGATQISDLMNQMQAKALEASDPGLDDPSRAALQLDFAALQNQVRTVVVSSEFNGTNLLDGAPAGGGAGGSLSALQSIQGTPNLIVANLDIQGMGLQEVESAAGLAADPVVNEDLVYDVFANSAPGGAGADETDAINAVLTDEFASLDIQNALELAKTEMAARLNTLGSAARQVDSQLTFTSKLSDTITSGIGSLVDADLAKESANLQALQLKQQLGVQALSIANQSPQAIASLFR
jgi:flagellin